MLLAKQLRFVTRILIRQKKLASFQNNFPHTFTIFHPNLTSKGLKTVVNPLDSLDIPYDCLLDNLLKNWIMIAVNYANYKYEKQLLLQNKTGRNYEQINISGTNIFLIWFKTSPYINFILYKFKIVTFKNTSFDNFMQILSVRRV